MNFKIGNDGKVLSREGIPGGTRWLSDGRLAFSWDEKGVGRLEYIAPRGTDGSNILFRRGVFPSFQCFLERDGATFRPPYRNVEALPYALTADWERDGDAFRFGVYAAEECAVFTLAVPQSLKNAGWSFKLQFYQSSQFIPAFNGDIDSRDGGFDRAWSAWEPADGRLSGGFEERAKDGGAFDHAVGVCLGANKPFTHSVSALNPRVICRTETLRPGGVYAFVLAFGTEREEAVRKCGDVCGELPDVLEKQAERYRRVAKAAPRLNSGDKRLDGFFSWAPLYHEALKSRDTAAFTGSAVKARSSRYWIWGWDSILANFSPIRWGDASLSGGMLDFFHRFSDPEKGLLHACRYDNNPGSFAPPASQGLYISLLWNYYQATGDKERLSAHYPFAKSIFDRVAALESEKTGLVAGTSLFPDFPVCLRENGRDLSLYNNSLFYGAARAMESLALTAGDRTTAERARALFLRTESAFGRYFFDAERGYFVNSVDADTLEKRDCVNLCGVMWDEDYLYDLLAPFAVPCAAYIEKHGLGEAGFRTLPLSDGSYDADANQLHCTWAATEEALLQFARLAGNREITDRWTRWTGKWAERLTIPEGISYFLEIPYPEFDEWNCEPGTFTPIAARKWYQEIFKIRLGITFDGGGVTFSAPLCAEYTLKNLLINGKKRAVKTAGAGRHIEYIEAGGRRFYGTRKLPKDAGGGTVTVKLSDAPQSIEIVSFTGGSLTEYGYENGTVTAAVGGAGTCRLYINGAAQILLDGEALECKGGRYEIFLELGRPRRLTVKPSV
ncbi:hypothetical protein FACS1894211_13340 [Clostridia bacterium]|nr:hypothetical protein FACS1894211_13340 [Clostridia bacterium]